MSFNSHIKQISRTAFFHLRNIAKIRHILSQKDAEKPVHAFVTSRLDYCNSLLSGCPNKSLKTLQLVQNAAARVLTKTRKRDHITPILASLHWLPIRLLSCGNIFQIQSMGQTPSLCLRVGLKLSFLIKLIAGLPSTSP